MNIGFIIPSLANRGPVLVVQDLVRQLVLHNHLCYVFYLTNIVEISMECPVQKIKMIERIDFQNFDVIHTHGLRPDMYVFFHRPWNVGTKFISTVHNYVIPDFSFQYNKPIAYVFGNLWMLFLHRHDKVVTLSKDAMEYYSKWFQKKKLAYAYNTRSVDVEKRLSDEEIQEVISFKGESLLIGVNTLLTYRKGIDMLIKALVKLPQYKLCVVGDGKIKNELIHLAKICQVAERCLFVGYKKDAYRFLSFYDIYAMPSRSEGFPLAMLEAALFHKPVICSDIPLFREIFVSEETVFFRLEDIDSLVRSVQIIIDNQEFGERIYQSYVTKYSIQEFYKRYIEIYQTT